MNKANKHRWKFFKAGGAFQASINTPDDIKNIGELDRKLWSALACPVSGLAFDQKLLDILDPKQDGKIRYDDIVASTQWVCKNLKDVSVLFNSPNAVSLSNINDDTDEGKALLLSAKTILANIGKPDAEEISLDDFADSQKIFANSAFNADGIITESAFESDDLKALFADILSVSPEKLDRSGKVGINKADIEKFYADAKAYVDWQNARTADSATLPLADATDSAYSAYLAVKDKMQDYFTRVEILAFDKSAQASVNATADQFAKILSADIAQSDEALKALPISTIATDGTIDLLGAVNPAWKSALTNFANLVAMPLCQTSTITKADWQKIESAFVPFAKWLGTKPSVAVEKIALARLNAILTEDKSAELYSALDADNAVSAEVENIGKVEKLVRLNSGLVKLLRNFVNFQEFYKDQNESIFQFGELYIDSRMCSLCIKVNDVAKHSTMSALSYGYLLYCTCKRKGEADMNIVAMVTAGDADNLIVGRNGLFYDRQGRVWDATISKIVVNPIGVSQAFFAPYKKLVRWISEQVAKRADTANANADASLQKGLQVDPKTKKLDLGIVAALGVAVGGLTTALGLIIEAFLGLGHWLPLGILGIILAISLPSVLVAWLKIRLRNIAPLLDANGWAVNSKACVNMTFGSHLTKTAKKK